MAILSNNLKALRKIKGITQQQLADAIGIKRSLIGAYEEGRAEPNIEKLTAFAQYFGISVDTLIAKELEENTSESRLLTKDVEGKNLRILSITTDNDERENIQLVPQKAAAGYLNGYSDPEYVSELPGIQFPSLGSGTFRAFEIKGDSMLPLESGTVIIGKYLDNWQDIKDDQTYIVISAQEGIVYKRVKNKIKEDESLLLISDNPSYSPYEITAGDIVEVWEAKAYFSKSFPSPEMDFGRLGSLVANLQKEISDLRKSK